MSSSEKSTDTSQGKLSPEEKRRLLDALKQRQDAGEMRYKSIDEHGRPRWTSKPVKGWEL